MASESEKLEIPDPTVEPSLLGQQMFGLVDFIIISFLGLLAIYWLFLRKKEKNESIRSFTIE